MHALFSMRRSEAGTATWSATTKTIMYGTREAIAACGPLAVSRKQLVDELGRAFDAVDIRYRPPFDAESSV